MEGGAVSLRRLVVGDACLPQTPVGLWCNADDNDGEAKPELCSGETGVAMYGRIDKSQRKNAKPDEKCVECRDERKDQPMVGLEIIRGARKAEGKDVWEDGRILDPENGREYRLRLTPVEGGSKLEVRGSFGPFGRTQTWVRAQ
mgnify:CR=1 FL=1